MKQNTTPCSVDTREKLQELCVDIHFTENSSFIYKDNVQQTKARDIFNLLLKMIVYSK